jgi:hypothetical protein
MTTSISRNVLPPFSGQLSSDVKMEATGSSTNFCSVREHAKKLSVLEEFNLLGYI